MLRNLENFNEEMSHNNLPTFLSRTSQETLATWSYFYPFTSVPTVTTNYLLLTISLVGQWPWEYRKWSPGISWVNFVPVTLEMCEKWRENTQVDIRNEVLIKYWAASIVPIRIANIDKWTLNTIVGILKEWAHYFNPHWFKKLLLWFFIVLLKLDDTDSINTIWQIWTS